jgi:hypothetical protein
MGGMSYSDRMERERMFERVWAEAWEAGMKAGRGAGVTPMVVETCGNPMEGGGSMVVREVVADGLCGFAWVNVGPANTPFCRWLRVKGRGRRDSYEGGVTVWMHEFGQSVARKEAMAEKVAEVLRGRMGELGLKRVRWQSRLD